ncbi:MAG: indole-3-glycerol phosphate synthase TrpC [Bacteroidales bacterium]|nr:indole-3-glycerol phosphate synthase TrpC [Candidatus Physcousia equi]
MEDVLNEIVAWKRIEVAKQKEALPPRTLYGDVERIMCEGVQHHSMHQALAASDSGIIAEFKRRSPSKGWIKEEGRPDVIPAAYADNGAAALSILTDEKYFGGKLDFIMTARPMVAAPILRKDFVVDEYQLFQARQVGADAVLLIAACLSKDELRLLAQRAHELQLEVLMEIHGEGELDYCDLDVDMVGVNNRNLGTFHTDVQNSFQMAALLPQEQLLVSESGIGDPAILRALRMAGFRGFLMGEHFMRFPDPSAELHRFIQQLTTTL